MLNPKDGLFHLLVLDASGEFLLAEHVDSQLLLPIMCSSLESRVTPAVQAYLKQLGIRASIGGLIKIRDFHQQYTNEVALSVAAQGHYGRFSASLDWFPVEECTDIRLLLPFQRQIVRDHASRRELLHKAQSVDSIARWVVFMAASHGRLATGEFTQFRIGKRRMLSCFLTADGGRVYCAAGSAVAGEADLAHWLTLHQPNSFPQTLAYDATTSLWLMDSAVGTPLIDSLTFENCKKAILKLAELQISLTSAIPPRPLDHLRDFRLSSIASRIDRDFGRLLEALPEEGNSVRTVGDSVLSGLRTVFEEALTLGVPDTFVHADADPSNIFLHEEGMRLIDLETAGWGFPFITPETFLRSDQILQRSQWREKLSHEYCRPWRTVISEYQLQRGMFLAPTIRVWARLRRLLDSTFESEPERYWHPSRYRYLLVGYAQKLARMAAACERSHSAHVCKPATSSADPFRPRPLQTDPLAATGGTF